MAAPQKAPATTTTNSMDKLTDDLRNVDFHHPFTPYDVQDQFMRTVYDVLERGDGQIGILESPTGTVRIPSPLPPLPPNHVLTRTRQINK